MNVDRKRLHSCFHSKVLEMVDASEVKHVWLLVSQVSNHPIPLPFYSIAGVAVEANQVLILQSPAHQTLIDFCKDCSSSTIVGSQKVVGLISKQAKEDGNVRGKPFNQTVVAEFSIAKASQHTRFGP